VPTFEPVHEAFQAYCDADPTYSAQLTVHVGAERVVDLTHGPGMQPDSLVPVYSSSNGATAVVARSPAATRSRRSPCREATHWICSHA
jgi:hypothetical protein